RSERTARGPGLARAALADRLESPSTEGLHASAQSHEADPQNTYGDSDPSAAWAPLGSRRSCGTRARVAWASVRCVPESARDAREAREAGALGRLRGASASEGSAARSSGEVSNT